MTRAHLANTPTKLHKLRASPTNALLVRLVHQDKHRQQQHRVPIVRKVNTKITRPKPSAKNAEQVSTMTKLHKQQVRRVKIVILVNTKMLLLNLAAKIAVRVNTLIK